MSDHDGDAIRRALGGEHAWKGGVAEAKAVVADALAELAALLAVGERDRQHIARLTEALERIADPMSANTWAAQYRADALRGIARAVLAGEEDARPTKSGAADSGTGSTMRKEREERGRAAGEGDTRP